MQEPGICIIGAGGLSSRRIYPGVGAAGGRLLGVCDLDADKAQRNARLFGGTPYTDWRRMLDDRKPDGVIICIGPEAHAQLAPEIVRLGIPVYTEKPPAETAAAALQVARAAHESGVLCTTAFKKRYCTAYERARKWIAGFPADDRYSISIDYASAQYDHATPRTTYLLDFAVHAIDLIGYLFGDVREVFCFSKGQDAFAVSLAFDTGAVGSMNLTDGRSFQIPTEEVEITIRGGNFMTVHNSSSWRITEDGKACEWREPPTFVSGGDSGNETGHLAQLVDFFAAVREGRSTRSHIYESYKSMVLYEAIRDSAQGRRIVPIQYERL